MEEELGEVVLLLGVDSESSNRATARIASAPGAVTPGRCSRWSKTVLREDGSGSWSGVRRLCSMRSFLACSFDFIDVSNRGIARRSFLDLPVESVPNRVVCCLVTNFFLGGGIRIFADVLVVDGVGVGAGTDGESSSEEEEMGSSSINGRN